MKVKIFNITDIDEDEERINQWLSSKPNIKIKFIAQSQSDAYLHHRRITISIWYE